MVVKDDGLLREGGSGNSFWTESLIGTKVGSLTAIAVNENNRIDQDGRHMIICFISEIVSRGASPPDPAKSPEPTKKLVAKQHYHQSPTTISGSAEVVNLPDIKLNSGSTNIKAGIRTTYHRPP